MGYVAQVWTDGPSGRTPILGADLTALSAAAAAPGEQQPAALYSGPNAPTPQSGSGEYLWFVTDGNGALLDIQSGKA